MDVNSSLDEFPATVYSSSFVDAKNLIASSALEATCSEGRNALFFALLRSREEEALALAKDLLEGHSAEVGGSSFLDAFGQTALFYAARVGHLQCVKLLVELHDFKVSHQDATDQTPIFYAARDGKTEVVRYLVMQGAPINHVDRNGDTPLFYAARDGQTDTVMAMLDLGADSSYRNKSRKYASGIARMMGHRKLATILDNARKNGKPSPSSGAEKFLRRGQARRQTNPTLCARDQNTAKRRKRVPDVASATLSGAETTNKRGRKISSESRKTSPPPSVAAGLRRSSKSSTPRRRSPALTADAGTENEWSGEREASEEKTATLEEPIAQNSGCEDDALAVQQSMREVCCLQFLSPLDSWAHSPLFKVEEFEAIFPELAVWEKAMPLPSLTLEEDPYRAEWHKLALELMRHLIHDVENSYLFREPVDPMKWRIPDYYDIIKEPMDFGTIQTKLEVGVEYRSISEFTKDLDKVFANCILYNSADSKIGKIASTVKEAAKGYSEVIGLTRMDEEEQRMMTESTRIIAEIFASRERMTREAEDVSEASIMGAEDEALSEVSSANACKPSIPDALSPADAFSTSSSSGVSPQQQLCVASMASVCQEMKDWQQDGSPESLLSV